MNIGIFGTGYVGQTLAEKLIELGHQVMMGTRNIDNTLTKNEKDNFGRPPFKEWIKENNKVKLSSFSETAQFSGLLINATNGNGSISALEMAGRENLLGKVLLDLSNPLDFSKGMPPTLTISNTDSLGELIQRTFPELKVVKALNTVNATLMVKPSLLKESTNIFLSGNDINSKQEIKKLLVSFGWGEHDIIDLGDISTSRGTEQMLPFWIRLMMNFQTPIFNFKIVK